MALVSIRHELYVKHTSRKSSHVNHANIPILLEETDWPLQIDKSKA